MSAPVARMHGRTHVAGGSDPIPGIGTGGGALEWEDVGTTTGGGIPALAPSRFLFLSKYLYDDVSNTLNPINFHVRNSHDAGYTPIYWTNDASVTFAHEGKPFNSAWTGYSFSSPGSGTTAFNIIRSGMYLLELTAFLISSLGSTDYSAWAQISAPAAGPDDTYSYGLAPFGSLRRKFAMNDSDDPRPEISVSSLVLVNSTPVPVSAALRQNSGSTTSPEYGPSVAFLRCSRLTPEFQ